MKKKRVHKIKDIPEKEYIIIGISTSANDYKLSWAINEKFGINLQQNKTYKVITKKITKEYIYFSAELENLTYSLIYNKSEKGSLIPELKNIDYFLKISGNNFAQIYKEIIFEIKEIKNISGVFEVNNSKIKKKTIEIFTNI